MRCVVSISIALIVSLLLVMNMPVFGSGDPDTDITREIPLPIPGDISSALHSLASDPFIENGGQWDPSILYVISTEYGKMALAKDGIYHWVHKFERREIDPLEDAPEFEMIDSCLVKALFEGGSPASVRGEDPVDTRYNFFLGNDSSRWASDVRGYGSVLYTNVWSGIDIHYYQKGGRVKYDLLLSPGADPDLIRMRIEGAGSIRNDGGDLIISTPIGVVLLDTGLVSYYTTGEHIPSSFLLEGNIYGFDMRPYDRTRSIVIDPEYRMNALNYSVTIGGIDEEKAYDIEIDNEGNIYACGWTSSSNFPVTPNAYQKNKFFSADAIVFILEAKGEKLISSTFIGGDKADMALGISLDENGNVYIAGTTSSSDFPVTETAYSRSLNNNSTDIFISKFNNNCSSLVYSTLIGGSNIEGSSDSFYDYSQVHIKSDGRDIVYLTTFTYSTDFPVTDNAYQKTLTGGVGIDIILMKFDINSSEIIYSTYLGGSGSDYPHAIEYHNGSVFVCGRTDSKDFDTTSDSYMKSYKGYYDGFVLKFDMENYDLVYSTYFGGSDSDYILDICIDTHGNVIGCGRTYSFDLPKTEHSLNWSSDIDGFLFKLDHSGSDLIFCRYHGCRGYDTLHGIALDQNSDIHVVGYSDGEFSFADNRGFQSGPGGKLEATYSKISGDGKKILYSTYIGGNDKDYAYDVIIDNSDEPIILGTTISSDFPFTRNFYNVPYRYYDIFILKLNLTMVPDSPVLNAMSGDSYVDLHWSPPGSDGGSPIVSYLILRGTKKDSMEAHATVSGLNFTDTEVQKGMTYHYTVRAGNRIGYGIPSEIVSARPISVPGPPELSVADFGDRMINLSWVHPSDTGGIGMDITGFKLIRTSDHAGENRNISLYRTMSSYLDLNVFNGVEYHYRIVAINSVGESMPSNKVIAKPMTVPSIVTNVHHKFGTDHIHLFWDPPAHDGGDPIMNYTITRTHGQDTDIITVGPVSEYNDTKIRRGIDYSYVIRAKNLAGHGPGSESIVARSYGRPSPPRDISYVLSIEGVYLTWEVPIDDGGSELLGINLYRRMSGQEDWIKIASLSNRTVWFRDVPPSISPFDYMLTSYNLAGESDPVLIFNVTPCGKPGIPVDIDISSGDGFINLSWSPPEDDGRLPILGYRLFRSTMDEVKISIDLLPSDGYYNDTSVQNGIMYSYRILAFNELGDGVISPFFEAVPIGLPSAPVFINVTSGDRFVDISWKPPLNDGGLPLNHIRIYRSVSSSSPVMVLETSLLEGSYRDRDLDNGVEYHYFLTALNGLGEGERSDIVVAVPSKIPSSPLSLMIVPLSDGTIVLTWTPPEDDGGSPIVGYKIYRSTGDEDMVGIAEVPADDLSYVERDLKVGITYRYGVSAFNARGESELSVGTFRIDDNPSSHMLPLLIGGSFIVLLSLSIVLLYAFLNYRKKMIDTGKNGSMIERQDE